MFGLFRRWAYDDPYITFRYAENIALGIGFVFNAGERVLSTTTPLFTLFLAATRLLTPNIALVANALSAFSVAVGGLLLHQFCKHLRAPAAGWVCLLVYPALDPLLTSFGSEMPTYVALCLAALYLHTTQRNVASAWLAAFAALTRNDGALVVVVIAACWFVQVAHKQLTLRQLLFFVMRFAAIYVLIVGAWLLFATYYFGSPLPVTLAAKQAQARMVISTPFALQFLNQLSSYKHFVWAWLALGLVWIGLGRTLLRLQQALAVVGWGLLYFAAYTLSGISGYFWYFAPLMPALVLLMGLGAQTVLDVVGKKVTHRQVHTFLNVIFVLALALPPALRLPRLASFPDKRINIYTAVGTWLQANTPPESSVGMLEVGIIGYYAQRRVVDFAGLIQPDIAQRMQRETTYDDLAVFTVEKYRPNYIVLTEGFAPALVHGYIQQRCTLVKTFERATYNAAAAMNVYRCA